MKIEMAEEIIRLLEGLLIFAIQGSVFAFLVVVAILDRRAFKRHYKVGLMIGAACFVMAAPSVAFTVAYLDRSVFWRRLGLPFSGSHFAGVFVLVASLAAVLVLLLKVGWHMIIYYVAAAEWERFRPEAMPLLRRTGRPPWGWILAASAFGLAAGALSEYGFRAAGIQEGEAIRRFRELFPGVAESSLLIRIPVTLLAVSAPAVVEELVFRGGMLGFLLRRSGNSRALAAVSIVAVSFLWALLHIANTDAPVVKCAQIFIVGLFFAEFARRSCVEAAIAAHLCLNVTVTVIAFAAFPEA